MVTIDERLENIEKIVTALFQRQTVKDFYSTQEFGTHVGKSEYTVREWCRLGRLKAEKKGSGRGRYQSWVVSHAELLRYQKEGLLPLTRHA